MTIKDLRVKLAVTLAQDLSNGKQTLEIIGDEKTPSLPSASIVRR